MMVCSVCVVDLKKRLVPVACLFNHQVIRLKCNSRSVFCHGNLLLCSLFFIFFFHNMIRLTNKLNIHYYSMLYWYGVLKENSRRL